MVQLGLPRSQRKVVEMVRLIIELDGKLYLVKKDGGCSKCALFKGCKQSTHPFNCGTLEAALNYPDLSLKELT